MPEQGLVSTNNIFTDRYAFDYEAVSAVHPRTWEIGSKRLVELLPPQNGDTVLEIGAGTGNSTIEIASANSEIGKLIAFEFSRGFAKLSWYKFGLQDMDLPADLDSGARAYIEEVKERAAHTGVHVNFGLARAELLAIRGECVDKIYMSQVIHWLAFADDDVFGENVDHLNRSISEFHRVLKNGGQIVFDTSAHQTDLEDHQLNGVRLKDTHVFSHPFYQAFVATFNELMQKNGFDYRVRPNKMGKYHNIFTIDSLLARFATFGFEPQDIEGRKFGFTVIPMNRDRLMGNILQEERMKLLTDPGLGFISESEKDRLFNNAFDQTMTDHYDLADIPVNEVRINFLLKKKSSF